MLTTLCHRREPKPTSVALIAAPTFIAFREKERSRLTEETLTLNRTQPPCLYKEERLDRFS